MAELLVLKENKVLRNLVLLATIAAGCACGQSPRTFTDGETFNLVVNKVVAQYGHSSQPIVKPGTMLYMQLRSLKPLESYTITVCYTSEQGAAKQSTATINTPPENDTVLWFPSVMWIEPGVIQSLSVRPNHPPLIFTDVQ
jgi:hypothetical protein